MRIQLFTVFDKAVNAFLQPFYARSRGEAVRSFMETVNDPKSQINKHSADYVMYYLGEFDDGSGLFHGVEPQRILSATECLQDDIFTSENKIQ